MEENNNVACINNIKCNSVAADIVKNKKFIHINKSLFIPHSSITYNKNNKKQTKSTATSAVIFFDRSTRALGVLLPQSVTNAKAAQHAATLTPVLSNADSGATGNYIRLADINVLRDVRVSAPTEQIAVAVADGNC